MVLYTAKAGALCMNGKFFRRNKKYEEKERKSRIEIWGKCEFNLLGGVGQRLSMAATAAAATASRSIDKISRFFCTNGFTC